MNSNDELTCSVEAALGANALASNQISIYIPDLNGDEERIIDIETWIDSAHDLLARINDGASVLHGIKGKWKSEKTGKILDENTVMVYSFIFCPDAFLQAMGEIRQFLHGFGKLNSQDAVMVSFNFDAIKITKYD